MPFRAPFQQRGSESVTGVVLREYVSPDGEPLLDVQTRTVDVEFKIHREMRFGVEAQRAITISAAVGDRAKPTGKPLSLVSLLTLLPHQLVV